MSYFGNKLNEVLQEKKMSQSDLARLTGLSQAHISKLISGDQPTVSVDVLENICINISRDAKEQASLIRAHLMDECRGPGSELIEIKIIGKPVALYDRPMAQAPLAPNIERAFELLRANVTSNKDLRDILISLANLCDAD